MAGLKHFSMAITTPPLSDLRRRLTNLDSYRGGHGPGHYPAEQYVCFDPVDSPAGERIVEALGADTWWGNRHACEPPQVLPLDAANGLAHLRLRRCGAWHSHIFRLHNRCTCYYCCGSGLVPSQTLTTVPFRANGTSGRSEGEIWLPSSKHWDRDELDELYISQGQGAGKSEVK